MSLYEHIRQSAKTDSRRFAKSVVCRILHGPILAFIQTKGLIPSSINPEPATGYDPSVGKIIVMPVPKYQELEKLMLSMYTTPKQVDPLADMDSYIIHVDSQEGIIRYIKQNMVIVTIDIVDGTKSGYRPDLYDVLIDSIDVNQAIQGTYVRRTVENKKDEYRLK